MYNKVELCGVNTAQLPVLSESEKRQLLLQAHAGDAGARERMVEGNLRLVLSVVQRFAQRGENLDDLFQVGCIGLIKAIDNFDPAQQVRFSTYGVPMIIGEIRRFLRDKKLPTSNWIAMWIFLASIAVVALLGAFSELRPAFDGKPLSMVLVIQMFMLLSGALIIIITKTNPASISKNEVFRSGMIAIVAVYGIAWMAETMFGAHMTEIKGVLGEMVKEYPWAYAIVLLLVSKFVNSQAAALAAIVPVALAIGVDPAYIVASAPACYGYYILPTYPSDLAAIQFDRSGTTHIGRFVINHSFILPGLIGVGVSCVFGWVFAAMYGFL